VTCLIGIGARGHSVAGIINQPYYNYREGPDAKLGRCIWGIIGKNTYFCFLPITPIIQMYTDKYTYFCFLPITPIIQMLNQPYYNYKEGPDAKLGRCIWGIIGLGKK
jgi:hypothetical protein